MTPVAAPRSSPKRRKQAAADFHPWRRLTTARELYAVPRGSVIANGSHDPVFWIKARGNGGRWHESTPTGQQLPADDLLVPADGLPSSQLALPAVVVRAGDGIVT